MTHSSIIPAFLWHQEGMFYEHTLTHAAKNQTLYFNMHIGERARGEIILYEKVHIKSIFAFLIKVTSDCNLVIGVLTQYFSIIIQNTSDVLRRSRRYINYHQYLLPRTSDLEKPIALDHQGVLQCIKKEGKKERCPSILGSKTVWCRFHYLKK